VALALVEPAFEDGKVTLNVGVLYLLLGGFGYVGSLFVLKAWLRGVPLGLLALFRVAVGTAFYHLLALAQGSTIGVERLYDWHLWRCMLWFGCVFVLLGQALWLLALRDCDPGLISLGTSFMFILNMIWAAILLRRYPTNGEYLGGAIIFLSVVSGLWEERWALRRKAAEAEAEAEAEAVAEEGAGVGGEQEGQEGEQEKGRVGAASPVPVPVPGAVAAAASGALQGADEASMQNKYI
jgi:drug/metabolite transporter (DMT)-like permease